MTFSQTSCPRAAMWAAVAAVFALGCGPRAEALEPLGLYVGAAIGQGWTEVDPLTVSGETFGAINRNEGAVSVLAGVRPVPLLAAEIAYVDLGHAHEELSLQNASSADVRMKGATVFGILYLPLPVVDLYVKAGLARLQTTTDVTMFQPGFGTCAVDVPRCAFFTRQGAATDTNFAAGAGLQFRLGRWGLRSEYQRFTAAGGHPQLAQIGLTWTIL